jgi:PAS domain S-box-containing protein
MKRNAPPISLAGSQLGEARHVCAFFNSEDEQYRVLLPFIKQGFECGDKAVHVVNPDQRGDHLHRLAAAGIDPAAAQASGQFELRTNTETYLRDGRFDQDRMLELFEQLASGNANGGFPLSRIVCHMDWVGDCGPQVRHVIEFESRVNEVWRRHDDAVICTYDLAKFGGDTVIDIMRTHPIVIIGGILQRNPFYVPAELFVPELASGRRSRPCTARPRPEVAAPVESPLEDVTRLRLCLNDLVSIMALPALWAGGEPSRVVSTLIDSLLEMLRLAFVFVRLNDRDGGPSTEVMRVGAPLEQIAGPRAIGDVIELLGDAPLESPPSAQMSIGEVDLSVATARLGLQGEIGIIVVGSQRPGFPAQTERLLLDVAANQAAVGLQQARLLGEQRRVANELDERVGRRTSELAAANEALRKEVAERRRTEEALREAESNSRLIIDTIPALAWSARPDGNAEFFNQHYLDFVGLSAEQARDGGWMAAVHPDDLNGVIGTWQRMVASQGVGETEARLRRHDGEYRWFLMRANPLRDEKGDIVKWYGIKTDIEDRKRAEVELRRAYDSVAAAQRLSRTGNFTADIVADEHKWSAELYRIFEIDPATRITVQTVRNIVHPEDRPSFDATFARVLGGADFDGGFRIVTASGKVKHIHAVAHLLELVAGRPVFIGAIQDVTENKLAEEALDRARSELAHVARVTTLSTLTASIAHEVNQPLSGIITNASTCLRLLDADPPNVEGARETARRTIRDGNRASDVITRLRALFSKKEFTLESLDLNEATREVIALSLSDLQRNRVILRSELADDLPRVTGDRVQLQQVILNLLRNASDAMAGVDDRPRQLLVRTERERSDRVRVTVRDAGVGVDPQSRNKLFDAFYTTKSGGMGIGLSVSRSIIERHQGRLWVEPNDGPGATFVFSIPCGPRCLIDAAAQIKEGRREGLLVSPVSVSRGGDP